MVINRLSRRDQKKHETRARIVAEAIRIFGEKGMESATVDEVAAAADIAKGTIYNYFATKEDIVVAFLVDLEHELQEEVARLVRRRRTIESALTDYILRHFELKAPYYAFVRVFLSQMLARGTPQSDWIRAIDAAADTPLLDLFSSLQERDALRADIRVEKAVAAFKVMHLGLTAMWAIEGPPWTHTHRAVRDQIRLFCSGLKG